MPQEELLGLKKARDPDEVELLLRINLWRLEQKLSESVQLVNQAEEERAAVVNAPLVRHACPV